MTVNRNQRTTLNQKSENKAARKIVAREAGGFRRPVFFCVGRQSVCEAYPQKSRLVEIVKDTQ